MAGRGAVGGPELRQHNALRHTGDLLLQHAHPPGHGHWLLLGRGPKGKSRLHISVSSGLDALPADPFRRQVLLDGAKAAFLPEPEKSTMVSALICCTVFKLDICSNRKWEWCAHALMLERVAGAGGRVRGRVGLYPRSLQSIGGLHYPCEPEITMVVLSVCAFAEFSAKVAKNVRQAHRHHGRGCGRLRSVFRTTVTKSVATMTPMMVIHRLRKDPKFSCSHRNIDNYVCWHQKQFALNSSRVARLHSILASKTVCTGRSGRAPFV